MVEVFSKNSYIYLQNKFLTTKEVFLKSHLLVYYTQTFLQNTLFLKVIVNFMKFLEWLLVKLFMRVSN